MVSNSDCAMSFGDDRVIIIVAFFGYCLFRFRYFLFSDLVKYENKNKIVVQFGEHLISEQN